MSKYTLKDCVNYLQKRCYTVTEIRLHKDRIEIELEEMSSPFSTVTITKSYAFGSVDLYCYTICMKINSGMTSYRTQHCISDLHLFECVIQEEKRTLIQEVEFENRIHRRI